MFCDLETNYQELRKEWASRSNMDQRKGRAGKINLFKLINQLINQVKHQGRVSNGSCYRLITRKAFKHIIKDHPDPAILR